MTTTEDHAAAAEQPDDFELAAADFAADGATVHSARFTRPGTVEFVGHGVIRCRMDDGTGYDSIVGAGPAASSDPFGVVRAFLESVDWRNVMTEATDHGSLDTPMGEAVRDVLLGRMQLLQESARLGRELAE